MFIPVLIAALLPIAVIVYFIYRKDRLEREPVSMMLKGVLYGAISALCVVLLKLVGFVPVVNPDSVGSAIYCAIFEAAVPEELLKFFFLWLLVRNNRYFNEYVDGIVYAVCIGMGFAGFENIGYLLNNYESWAAVGVVRAISAVPMHFFFAVIMGYYYALSKFGPFDRQRTNLCYSIVLPIAFHALYDGLLMVSDIAGGVLVLLYLVVGLYIYLAQRSKKHFNDLLARDAKVAEHDRAAAEKLKKMQPQDVEEINPEDA